MGTRTHQGHSETQWAPFLRAEPSAFSAVDSLTLVVQVEEERVTLASQLSLCLCSEGRRLGPMLVSIVFMIKERVS